MLLYIVPYSLFAQNIADENPNWRADSARIHQTIDSIFKNLDKTKMTTIFLFERITFPKICNN